MTAPTAHVWTPPAAVRAAGVAAQGAIPYRAGSTIARDGDATQLPTTPGMQALAAWLRARAGVRSVGLDRSPAKPSTAGRVRDMHEDGRAGDVMIAAPGTPAGNAAGDAIANFLVLHASSLGVQLVIWAAREWSASRVGAAWEDYAGASDHRDHVHVEISPDAAALSAAEMRARIDAAAAAPVPGTGGGGAVLAVLLAAAAWLLRGRR